MKPETCNKATFGVKRIPRRWLDEPLYKLSVDTLWAFSLIRHVEQLEAEI